jgi:aconitate hydratase
VRKKRRVVLSSVAFLCDTDALDQGDQLEIDVSNLDGDMILTNKTKGETLAARHDLSPREVEMIKMGGLLSYTTAQNKKR